MLLEVAYTGAWCHRQPSLGGPGAVDRFLNPEPPARVLEGEEAADAARKHAELASLFESLAETQRLAREKGSAAAGTIPPTETGAGRLAPPADAPAPADPRPGKEQVVGDGLGDLGILTVPLEGDLGPLLEAFDRAQVAAQKAGEDAAAAFEAGQLSQQSKVAAEAADAFASMGQVQMVAAQKGKAAWDDLSKITVRLSQKELRDLESASVRSARAMGSSRLAASLLGKALGEVSGAGHLAGSVMGKLAAKAGPWGIAIAAIAAAVAVMFKSFKLAGEAAKDIDGIDKALLKILGRTREVQAAELADILGDTDTAELVKLQHDLADAQESVAKARSAMERGGSITDPAGKAARKEEAEAIAAEVLARDALEAAQDRQAASRAKAKEKERDEEEKKSKEALTEVLDDATAARRRLADETAANAAKLQHLFGGEDPDISLRRREIARTREEAEALMRSSSDLDRAKGGGMLALADDMEDGLEVLIQLQAALREKESSEEFRRLWTENADLAEEAIRRVADLDRTEGERELAALAERHARELRAIQENETLKAEVKAQAIRAAEDRQAEEFHAVREAQVQDAAEAQEFIERAIEQETAQGTEKQVLAARERYAKLRAMAIEHGLDLAIITKAEAETIAAIRAAGAATGDKSDEERRARQADLYRMGLKQKDIREQLRLEGFQVEETADGWNRYSRAVGSSVAALEAMRRFRAEVAAADQRSRAIGVSQSQVPSYVDFAGYTINRRPIPGVTAQSLSASAAKAPEAPVVEMHLHGADVVETQQAGGRTMMVIEGRLARSAIRGGVLGRTMLRLAGARRRGANR